MITPDTHVYCTKCKWLRFCNEDIPYCISESQCDINNCEDSRPFKERPCYEEIDWETEYQAILEISKHYESELKRSNNEELDSYRAVRGYHIKKESDGEEDIKSDIMYNHIEYIINNTVVQPIHLYIHKDFSTFEYEKENGDYLRVKVYISGSVDILYHDDQSVLPLFLENFDGLDRVIYNFFKSKSKSDFSELLMCND